MHLLTIAIRCPLPPHKTMEQWVKDTGGCHDAVWLRWLENFPGGQIVVNSNPSRIFQGGTLVESEGQNSEDVCLCSAVMSMCAELCEFKPLQDSF